MTMLQSQTLVSAAVLPAQDPVPPSEPTRYVDASVVGPGLVGFILFVFLCVAVFLLWRSMNKQLTRIDFDDPTDTRPVNSPFTVTNSPPATPVAAAPKSGADPQPKAPGG